MKTTVYRMSSVALLLLLAAGCGAGGPAGSQSSGLPADESPRPVSDKPVTIKVVAAGAALSDDEFNRFIAEPVKKVYPNMTMERINFQTKGSTLEELVAAKADIDIYADFQLNVSTFMKLGLAYNMEELIRQNRFDLNRIQPVMLDAVKVGSDLSYLAGIPIYNNGMALFYNKDVFDKFGVPYPQDGMTWEQIRDAAAKITRSDGGVQYWGLYPDGVYRGAYQLSLPWADWKNNKAIFQTQQWKELFELWYGLYTVPGLAPNKTNYDKLFLEGQVGMYTASNSKLPQLAAAKNLNWDLTTYPENPKAPGVGTMTSAYSLYIINTSVQKEEAFQAISVLLSDEAQLEISRGGRMSVLNNQDVQQQFGQNNEQLRGKNVIAFTKTKPAATETFRNIQVVPIVNAALTDMLYNGKDINTALREADEKMNQALQEMARNP